MLKIKITWPLVLLFVFALFVWMIRSQSTVHSAAHQDTRPRPAARRRSSQRSSRNGHRDSTPFVIHMDEPHPVDCAGGMPDYDTETERLDREAAEAAAAVHSARQSYTMPKGVWQQ